MKLKNIDMLYMSARKFGERIYYQQQYANTHETKAKSVENTDTSGDSFIAIRNVLQEFYNCSQKDNLTNSVNMYISTELIKIFLYQFNKLANTTAPAITEKSNDLNNVLDKLYHRVRDYSGPVHVTNIQVAWMLNEIFGSGFNLRSDGSLKYFFNDATQNRSSWLEKDILTFGGDRKVPGIEFSDSMFLDNVRSTDLQMDPVKELFWWIDSIVNDTSSKFRNPIFRAMSERLDNIKEGFNVREFITFPSEHIRHMSTEIREATIEISIQIIKDLIEDLRIAMERKYFLSSEKTTEWVLQYASVSHSISRAFINALEDFYAQCINPIVWSNTTIETEEEKIFKQYCSICQDEELGYLAFLPPDDPRYQAYWYSHEVFNTLKTDILYDKKEKSVGKHYIEKKIESATGAYLSVRFYYEIDANNNVVMTTSPYNDNIPKIVSVEFIPMKRDESGNVQEISEAIPVNRNSEQIRMSKIGERLQYRMYNEIPNSSVINKFTVIYDGNGYLHSVECGNPDCRKKHAAYNLLFTTNIVDSSGLTPSGKEEILKGTLETDYDGDICFDEQYVNICDIDPDTTMSPEQKVQAFGNKCLKRRGIYDGYMLDPTGINIGYIPPNFVRSLSSMSTSTGVSDERRSRLFYPNSAMISPKLFICPDCGHIAKLPNYMIEQLTVYARCEYTRLKKNNDKKSSDKTSCSYIPQEFTLRLDALETDFLSIYESRLMSYSILSTLKEQYDASVEALDSNGTSKSFKNSNKLQQEMEEAKKRFTDACEQLFVHVDSEDSLSELYSSESSINSKVLDILKDYSAEVSSMTVMEPNTKLFNYLLTLASDMGINEEKCSEAYIIQKVLDNNPFYARIIQATNILREIILCTDMYGKFAYRDHNRIVSGGSFSLIYGVTTQSINITSMRNLLAHIISGLYNIIPVLNLLEPAQKFTLSPHRITEEDNSLLPVGSLVFFLDGDFLHKGEYGRLFKEGPIIIPAPNSIFETSVDEDNHKAIFFHDTINDEFCNNGVSFEEFESQTNNQYIFKNPFNRLYNLLTKHFSVALYESDFVGLIIGHNDASFRNGGYTSRDTLRPAKDIMSDFKDWISHTSQGAIYTLFDLLYAKHRSDYGANSLRRNAPLCYKSDFLASIKRFSFNSINDVISGKLPAEAYPLQFISDFIEFEQSWELGEHLYVNRNILFNEDFSEATISDIEEKIETDTFLIPLETITSPAEYGEKLYNLLHFNLDIEWGDGYEEISSDNVGSTKYLDTLAISTKSSNAIILLYTLGLTSLLASHEYFEDCFNQNYISKEGSIDVDRAVESYFNNCMVRWGGQDMIAASTPKDAKHNSTFCCNLKSYLSSAIKMPDDVKNNYDAPLVKIFTLCMRLMVMLDQTIHTNVGYLMPNNLFMPQPKQYSLFLTNDISLQKFLPGFIYNQDNYFIQRFLESPLLTTNYPYRNALSKLTCNSFYELNEEVLMSEEYEDTNLIETLEVIYKDACMVKEQSSAVDSTTFFNDSDVLVTASSSVPEDLGQLSAGTSLQDRLPAHAHSSDNGLGISDILSFINSYLNLSLRFIPEESILEKGLLNSENSDLGFHIYYEYNPMLVAYYKKDRNVYFDMEHLFFNIKMYSQICTRQVLYECRELLESYRQRNSEN